MPALYSLTTFVVKTVPANSREASDRTYPLPRSRNASEYPFHTNAFVSPFFGEYRLTLPMIPPSPNSLAVRRHPVTGTFFSGLIDYVHIYNRAVSP